MANFQIVYWEGDWAFFFFFFRKWNVLQLNAKSNAILGNWLARWHFLAHHPAGWMIVAGGGHRCRRGVPAL